MAQMTPQIPTVLLQSRVLARQLVRLLIVVPAFVIAGLLLMVDRRRPAVQSPVPAQSLRQAPEVELSVVIPFYNPGDALRPNVLELVSALRTDGISHEVLAVSDGSTDGSEASIADIDGVRVITQPRNMGKGAALHSGFSQARGQ